MEILRYNELDVSGHAAAFERVVACLRRGDFRAAQVKKLAPTPYYRAELSAADRLLFRFAAYGGRTYLLLLEIVAHHAYDRSRFLNGAAVAAKYQMDYHGGVFPDVRRKMEQYGVDFRNPLNQTPLMIAAARGLDALIRDLIRDGANPHLTDNWGRTPLQIALRDSFRSEEYARRHIGAVYTLLAPASLKVRVDGRLEKIDARRMEFFVLNSMIAIMQDLLRDKIRWNTPGFQTGDVVHALQYFPEHVIPAHRRNRQAITTALAGNEVFREGPRNLRLFVRARRGYYIPNPLMEIELGDAFVNVYTLIGLEALAQEADNEGIRRFVEFLELIKKDLTTPAVPVETEPPTAGDDADAVPPEPPPTPDPIPDRT